MILLRERAGAQNPWAEAFVLCPEGASEFSLQGFNPGNRPPKATRPEGGARPNVLTRLNRGPMAQLSHVPIAHADFARQQMRASSGTRISRPFRANRLFEGSQG